MIKRDLIFLQTLEELFSRRGVKPGLERIRALLKEFRIRRLPFKVIHVAGSNGKGTTATAAARILEKCGKRTGLYTSPHLIRVNERISVNGKEIGDEDLLSYMRSVQNTLARKNRKLLDEMTFFEFLTLISVLYFSDRKVEWAVLEAGMGGRLDATNAFDSRVCVITDICREHTEYLGRTQGDIAREKFAIIKPRSSVVTYVTGELLGRTLDALRIRNRDIFRLGRDFFVTGRMSQGFEQFLHYRDAAAGTSFDYSLPTPVAVQRKNTAAAVKAVYEALKREMDPGAFACACRRALSNFSVPGRFEIIRRDPYLVVDVCHNAAGVRELVSGILKAGAGGKWCVIFGALRDKDYRRMFLHLKKISRDFIFVRPESGRALAPRELLDAVRGQRGRASIVLKERTEDALRLWRSEKADRNCLVCGSFYVAGPSLGILKRSYSAKAN